VLLDQQSLDAFRFWQVGAIAGRDLTVLLQVLPFLGLGLFLALVNAPGVNALALGEDVARSLGQRIVRTRIIGVLAITLLIGGAVAACGPIGFLGLVVPHAARAITGPDYRWLLPCSGLLGAALLLVADVLGRVVARPAELEVGIMMAVFGAPFFIALVRRKKLVKL
jgi:iron complex transport system permease protein